MGLCRLKAVEGTGGKEAELENSSILNPDGRSTEAYSSWRSGHFQYEPPPRELSSNLAVSSAPSRPKLAFRCAKPRLLTQLHFRRAPKVFHLFFRRAEPSSIEMFLSSSGSLHRDHDRGLTGAFLLERRSSRVLPSLLFL
jgi:hypothetical protein